jgi:hypothetical protein
VITKSFSSSSAAQKLEKHLQFAICTWVNEGLRLPLQITKLPIFQLQIPTLP